MRTLVIDFANKEATIAEFGEAGDELVNELTTCVTDLGNAEINYDRVVANAELEVRNGPVKVTEGYVSAAINANTEVNAARTAVERLRARATGLRAALDNLDRKAKLFREWLAGQRPVGLNA